VAGWKVLEKKIRTYQPRVVALVGVTLYRAIRPLLETAATPPQPRSRPIPLGFQPATIHGARICVLPNPSGRNANFSYAEMLEAFAALERSLNS
jgi:TDG/mug DNA glycosylase family protein